MSDFAILRSRYVIRVELKKKLSMNGNLVSSDRVTIFCLDIYLELFKKITSDEECVESCQFIKANDFLIVAFVSRVP
jgi:hypothetical protein